jgi:WD40 repeat protein
MYIIDYSNEIAHQQNFKDIQTIYEIDDKIIIATNNSITIFDNELSLINELEISSYFNFARLANDSLVIYGESVILLLNMEDHSFSDFYKSDIPISHFMQLSNGHYVINPNWGNATIFDEFFNELAQINAYAMIIEVNDEIVTATEDGYLCIWNINDYNLVNCLEVAEYVITHLELLQDNFLAVSADGIVMILNTKDQYKTVNIFKTEPQSLINWIFQMNNGDLVIQNRFDNISIWGYY